MTDIVSYSLYGLGSVDSLLNLKKYELETMKLTLRDSEIKEIFKAVKLHAQ